VLEFLRTQERDEILYNSTAFIDLAKSYFTTRWVHFWPHIVGAVIWWNLYFLQLIPKIRNKFIAFHRFLGRILFVTAAAQVVTAIGLANNQHSSVVKIVSWIQAVAISYCIFWAWHFARVKDVAKHKYWVVRLVGYMQFVALQRFWIVFLVVSHQSGWHGLYGPVTESTSLEERNKLLLQQFDDSFILCALTGIYSTEWYMASTYGWTRVRSEVKKPSSKEVNGVNGTKKIS